MKTRFPELFFFAFLFYVSFLASPAFLQAADGNIGKVIGLAGDAAIVREGREIPVEVGQELRVSDSLRTGSEGRVRILFNDDSMAAVGPGSLFRMEEYVDSGSEQSFKAHVAEGLARFVTGKIVEANPRGFSVTAPEAVVGIRGTIITVRAEHERTTVYVENTTRNVYANNVDVPSGNKISFPSGTQLPEPITQEDRREISKDLAFLGGEGSAAAAPEPASEETRTADAGSSDSGEDSSDSGDGSSESGSSTSESGSSSSGSGDSSSGSGGSSSGSGGSSSGSGSASSGSGSASSGSGSSSAGSGSSSSGSGSASSGSGSSSAGSGSSSSGSGGASGGGGGGASGGGGGAAESGSFAGATAVLTGETFSGSTLAETPVASQSMGDSIRPELIFARYAYSSGGLPTPGGAFQYLDFSFEINLQNGDMRDATIVGRAPQPMAQEFIFTGGHGGYFNRFGIVGYRALNFTGADADSVGGSILLPIPGSGDSLGDPVAYATVGVMVFDSYNGVLTPEEAGLPAVMQ
ncbi:MAG: FecR family protein [Deltaproteobacteria bacterium]|jgi:hypothetical protein|nr:FecR family protein [Deltaproteobacteria bacterium]